MVGKYLKRQAEGRLTYFWTAYAFFPELLGRGGIFEVELCVLGKTARGKVLIDCDEQQDLWCQQAEDKPATLVKEPPALGFPLCYVDMEG